MENEIDSKYEFNAPKFIDFLQGDVDEDADKWFDERDGDEGGIDIDLVPYYEKALNQNGFKNATSAITAALNDNENLTVQSVNEDTNCKDTVEDDAMECDDQPQNEAVEEKNIQENHAAVDSPKDEKNDPQQEETVTESEASEQNAVPSAASQPKSRKSNIRTSWNSPVIKKDKQADARRSQPLRGNGKRPSYNESKKRKKTLSLTDEPIHLMKRTKVGPTMPETPSFVRKLRERGMKRGQSSDAIQLNKIKELQKQTRAQLKRNDKNMRQALKAMPYQPTRSVSVTKPKEFNFATDNRLKEHSMKTRSDAQKPFENQLRRHPPSPTYKKDGGTKPKPFNFVLADKGSAIPKQKWESMAQFAMNYQTKTPERFRLKPRKDQTSGEKKKSQKIQVTNPKTPQLMTKARSRPVCIESAVEREMKEAEAIKNYHFKATEFNPKIVEMQGMYGVKQMPEASTTQMKPFKFESDARIQQRKEKEESQKPQENVASTKAKINTSLPSKGEKPRCTEVKPFSFEHRDKERYQKKEHKIKGIIDKEEKLHEFHARPLPSFSPEALPAVATKAPTQPEPFHISSGSTAYQQKFRNKLHSEAERDKVNRLFKAQSADVVKNRPFKPLAGLIPPTNPNEVMLNSDIRAKERAKFDEWRHEQERLLEMEKERIEREKEEEEEKLVKQLRRDCVPKSQPIRHYKPVEVQKSAKSLTEPQTPNFECKKRALMRL